MSDVGPLDYVPDHLYERLFQPWKLSAVELPLCKEDWQRVDAITALPWAGMLMDFGAGDGALAAMVMSRNPAVKTVWAVERDKSQWRRIYKRWEDWRIYVTDAIYGRAYDGVLCCEVLEHLSAEDGHDALCRIREAMKPGGMLCVTVPHAAGPRATYPGHVRQFTASELKHTLNAAGFVVDDGDTIGGKDVPVWLMALAHA